MIKPEQKGEPYLPHDGMIKLDEYKPIDPRKFKISVEVGIGQEGREGFDIYTLDICTPQWLSEDLKNNGKPIFINGMLLVELYQPKIIANRISEIIRSTTGKDWNEYNRKIARYFHWEFEDSEPIGG